MSMLKCFKTFKCSLDKIVMKEKHPNKYIQIQSDRQTNKERERKKQREKKKKKYRRQAFRKIDRHKEFLLFIL